MTQTILSDSISTGNLEEPSKLCFHCGADNGAVPVEAHQHFFCCEGCSAVYQLLCENSLCNYYDLNPNPGNTRSKNVNPEYGYLDDPEIFKKLVLFSNGKTARISFRLPQIHCSSCIWLLEHLYRINPDIVQSEVNFSRKEIFISFNENKTKLSEIASLLSSLGYSPDISRNQDSTEKEKSGNRSLWIKIGVAGFCFGNIMLLSFPEYFGITETSFIHLFGYLNIAIAIPSAFFSGSGYFISAWNGLRNRIVNMDVPIAVGMLVIFIRSVFEILSQTGSGYLDSLSGLVFFLLIGKVFQQKTFDLLSFDRDYRSYFPLGVMRKKGNLIQSVPVTSLKIGDRIILRNAELVPADSVLIKGITSLDYSFVTGESERTDAGEGEFIYAGGRHFGTSIELELVNEASQIYITRLWNHQSFSKVESGDVSSLSNRIGKNFTIAVLAISFVASIFWWMIDSTMIVKVVSSILIVACPCALALSLPFTMGSVLAILGRNGFYLKGPAVIENLAEADTIVFDKTGTLTLPGSAGIVWNGLPLNVDESLAIKSLVSHSTHPLSVSLFKELKGKIDQVEHFFEYPGKGIAAEVAGLKIKLGSRLFVCGYSEYSADTGTEVSGTKIWVSINEVPRGHFILTSALRPGVIPLLEDLKEKYSLALISGDNEKDKKRFTDFFQNENNIHFHQTPENKLKFIEDIQQNGKKVIMAGDGLNDAGALKQSDVGISIAEDISSFTPASDAILDGERVGDLGLFLAFCKKAMRIVRSSFYLSFMYNFVGVSIAISGNLSPIVAAILMPLSSVSVVLFTTLSVKIAANKMGLSKKIFKGIFHSTSGKPKPAF